MTIAEAPPRSPSVESVAARMNAHYAELKFGLTPDPTTIERLRRMYGRLDAIATRTLEEREVYQLTSGFTSLAELCKESLVKYRRSYASAQRDKVTVLMGEVLLDKASLLMRVPGYDSAELERDVDTAEEAFWSTSAMRGNPGKYRASRYDHKTVGSLFGTLSADTTRLYLRAQKIRANRELDIYYRQQGMLRAKLGSITATAVQHAGIMAAEHIRKPSAHLMGRFSEVCAFVKYLFDWQDAAELEDGFVRLAVEREDCPQDSYEKRRGFDLLVFEREKERLIQVKTSFGGGMYHESIEKVRLTNGAEVTEDPGGLVSLMRATMEPNADYTRLRQEMNAQFCSA